MNALGIYFIPWYLCIFQYAFGQIGSSHYQCFDGCPAQIFCGFEFSEAFGGTEDVVEFGKGFEFADGAGDAEGAVEAGKGVLCEEIHAGVCFVGSLDLTDDGDEVGGDGSNNFRRNGGIEVFGAESPHVLKEVQGVVVRQLPKLAKPLPFIRFRQTDQALRGQLQLCIGLGWDGDGRSAFSAQ